MKTNSFAYAAVLAVLIAAPLATASDDKAASASTTVTGCVTTTNDGKNFVLTEATKDMQAPPKTWTLVATDGVDLSKYANHKVEVTGASDKTDLGMTPTASTAAEAVTGAKLKVKTVKDISNTCS